MAESFLVSETKVRQISRFGNPYFQVFCPAAAPYCLRSGTKATSFPIRMLAVAESIAVACFV